MKPLTLSRSFRFSFFFAFFLRPDFFPKSEILKPKNLFTTEAKTGNLRTDFTKSKKKWKVLALSMEFSQKITKNHFLQLSQNFTKPEKVTKIMFYKM